MDFDLEDHQTQLLDAATRWAADHDERDALVDAGARRQAWQQLIDAGWLTLLDPESGAGSLLDAALLTERLATGRCPLPVASALIAPLLARSAGLAPEGPAPLLAGTLAGSAPLLGRNLDLDSGLVLIDPGAWDGEASVSVAVAAPGSTPVELVQDEAPLQLHRPVDPLPSAGQPWQPAEPSAFEAAWLAGAVLSAAELVGLAQAVLDEAAAYAKDRVQGGKPIGAHQAVQHRLADMLGYVERCRYLTYAAASVVPPGDAELRSLDPMLARQAKALAARDCLHTIRSAHQVLGAIAYSAEHPLPGIHKQALVAALEYGSANDHWTALEPS